MPEKILVIGKGFLGGNIVKRLKAKKIPVESTNFTTIENSLKLDITQPENVERCLSLQEPSIVINCASINQIDFLEQNPNLAYSVNSKGAKNVADICNKFKIKLIHISTDSVFDGEKGMYNENDQVNPVNVYAKSKVLVEKHIQNISRKYVIVRTNFFGFDQRGHSLFNWIYNSLSNNQKITGFSDIFFNPLEVSNLSDLIIELTNKNHNGIFHLSSNDPISKYEFILRVAEVFHFDKNLINKGSYSNHKSLIAKRPKNTTLDNTKARKNLTTPINSTVSSLEKIKNEINS